MELEGIVGAFSLRELIEMIVYSSVTGVLELGEAGEAGRLFFRDGQPYDAAAGGLTGFEAVALMFEARAVPFRFEAGPTSPSESMWMDPLELIERGEDLAATWGELRPYIPGLDWVPTVRATSAAEHVHISDVAWPVISAADGQLSIAQIAERLDMAPVDVCSGLVALLKQNLLVLHPPRLQAPAAASMDTSGDSQQDAGGFFERLLARTLEEERRRTSEPTIERVNDA